VRSEPSSRVATGRQPHSGEYDFRERRFNTNQRDSPNEPHASPPGGFPSALPHRNSTETLSRVDTRTVRGAPKGHCLRRDRFNFRPPRVASASASRGAGPNPNPNPNPVGVGEPADHMRESRQVACGANHSAMVDDGGRVWLWGAVECLPRGSRSQVSPSPVPFLTARRPSALPFPNFIPHSHPL